MRVLERSREERSRQGDGEELGLLHGRLGSHAHRAGEMSRAVQHLERGLELLRDSTDDAAFRTRVVIESELVEIAGNQGDYERAESICRDTLQRNRARGDSETSAELRRVEMILYENLGHLHLRRFQFDEARAGFERSLEVGSSLGLIPETSLILNNLGILHIQENRFSDAIDAYQRARAISEQFGDDQSLVAIVSNLAVLHVKIGQTDLASDALNKAVVFCDCDSIS